MKNIYYYNLWSASDAGINGHPQIQIENMGYKVLRYEGHPIGDCVFIETDRLIDPLPDYIEHRPDFKFTVNPSPK